MVLTSMIECVYCHQHLQTVTKLGFTLCQRCVEDLTQHSPQSSDQVSSTVCQHAVIYLRVSTKKQGDDPQSGLFIQLRHCIEYCFAHHLQCHKIYQDIHSAVDLRNSGLRGLHQMIRDMGFTIYCPHRCHLKNPMVARLRRAIQEARHLILMRDDQSDDDMEPHIDQIVVDNLDRFGRDLKNMLSLKQHFLAYKTTIVAVSQGFQTGNDLGEMSFSQHALEAELFSRDRSIRIKSVKQAKKNLGHFVGGRPRYGCTVEMIHKIRKVTSNPEEQLIMTTIRRMSEKEHKSPQRIAKLLNQLGIRKRGQYWTTSRVRSVLNLLPSRETTESDTDTDTETDDDESDTRENPGPEPREMEVDDEIGDIDLRQTMTDLSLFE